MPHTDAKKPNPTIEGLDWAIENLEDTADFIETPDYSTDHLRERAQALRDLRDRERAGEDLRYRDREEAAFRHKLKLKAEEFRRATIRRFERVGVSERKRHADLRRALEFADEVLTMLRGEA